VRRRDFPAARQRLERAIAEADVPLELRGELHLRLAQLCEHRFKDFETATRHAALGARAEEVGVSARRLARLKVKSGLWAAGRDGASG